MEKVVVAGCRPKPGFEREIEKLVRAHHSTLVPKGLATSRVPMILRGIDGALVEIYEMPTDTPKITLIITNTLWNYGG